jgi:hypothetical protein
MGEVRAYHVPLAYLQGLGLACLPVVLHLRQVIREYLFLTTHFLVQACQHLWLVYFNDIYQQFTFVDHTLLSSLLTVLMLTVVTRSYDWVTILTG